jgi:hypothetical protein
MNTGQIGKVNKKTDALMHVMGPLDAEVMTKKSTCTQATAYVLTDYFPPFHYVIILNEITSLTDPGEVFYSVRLITHSDKYGNIKIEPPMVANSSISLTVDSYFTRDIFLVNKKKLDNNVYGELDMNKINAIII